jgi:2-(1,2-epoxy-1,2-dihydrophenyl)acetyl-CoA isomerase
MPEYQAAERGMSYAGWSPGSPVTPSATEPAPEKGWGYQNYQAWRHQARFGGFQKRRGEPLLELDKPVIAMVNGSCHGFGCDVAFYCDIIIACEEHGAFEWTYIHRGMVPAEGATYFLPRIAGKHIALECLWLGRQIPARQAYEWGLINHIVPHSQLESFTYDLARRLATESPPMIMGAIKWAVHKGYGDFIAGLNDHLDFIRAAAQVSFQGSEDAKEGPRAFVEKRKPVYKFR